MSGTKTFEDTWNAQLDFEKDLEAQWIAEAPQRKAALDEFKRDVESTYPPGWAKERRLEYYRTMLSSATSRLVKIRLSFGKELLSTKFPDLVKGFMALTLPEIERKIERWRKAVFYFSKPIDRDGLSESEISAARDFPLWQFLESKKGAKIKCPFPY